jgi:hypothetical protein
LRLHRLSLVCYKTFIMSDAEKVIHVIGFSRGEEIDWAVWEETFLARARRKGHKKILLGKETVSADAEFEAISDDAERKKL